MHYSKFALLLVFLAFSNAMCAQAFKKGVVIMANGDTLAGYIDDGSYESLSRTVSFKQDMKADTATVYSPNEIKEFQFADGDFFISGMARFSFPKNNGTTEDLVEMRFLHRLQANEKSSLFELNDEHVSPLFLQKSGGPLQLLCLDENGEKAYLDVLAQSISDCENMSLPADLPLEISAIRDVLDSHESCRTPMQPNISPKMMAWGGISLPLQQFQENYQGLGKMLQFEYRPIDRGLLSNLTIGAEFL